MKHLLLVLLTLCVIPFAANAQATDPQIVKVRDTLHMLVSPNGGNIAVSHGADGVFIVDDNLTGRGEIIDSAIKTLSGQDVKFIVNTHYHFDHTGNNEFFGGKDTIIVAHDNVRKRLSTDQFITYFKRDMKALSKDGLPVVTFSNDITFHYNGDDIKVLHVANAHTDGDAIAFFTKENVIVAGDTVFNGLYPFIDVEHGGTISGMVKAADVMLGLADENTIIVPGHGPLLNKAELQSYRYMLATIEGRISKAMAEGKTLEEIVALKPTQEFDAKMSEGIVAPDAFVGIAYESLKP